jgi:hypothetical protein
MTETKKLRRSTKHEEKMRWLGENEDWLEAEYPGMWVAISDDGLAGVGNSPGEAEAAAKAKGVHEPLLTGIREKRFQGVTLIRTWR